MVKSLILPILALMLVGCASGPAFQGVQPVSSGERQYSLSRSALLDKTDATVTHLDSAKNILYVQVFGGGGVALGLMGPLGVAANVAMINAQTDSDAELLKDKIAIEPRQAFLTQAQSKKLKIVAGTDDATVKLTPYLYVSKTEGEQMLLASVLLLEQGEGKEKWVGKYMYQLPTKYGKLELSQLSAAQTQQLTHDVAQGYSTLIDYIVNEQAPGEESDIKFKSDFLTPRFNFDITARLVSRNDQVTWVRMPSGIYALQAISFTPVGEKR